MSFWWILLICVMVAVVALAAGFVIALVALLIHVEKSRELKIGKTTYRLVPMAGENDAISSLSPAEEALRSALRSGKMDGELERAWRRNAERRGSAL